MTIQISVLIWTLLCFLLLMWTLNRQLFQPLLTLMDERRRKITDAAAEKDAARRQREEEIHHLLETRRRALEAACAPELLRQAQEEAARQEAAQKTEYARLLEQEQRRLDAELETVRQHLGAQMDGLAAAFADRVAKRKGESRP